MRAKSTLLNFKSNVFTINVDTSINLKKVQIKIVFQNKG